MKIKNTSPTHSANDDVLQLDLDDFSLEELNDELDPPKVKKMNVVCVKLLT